MFFGISVKFSIESCVILNFLNFLNFDQKSSPGANQKRAVLPL